MTEEEQTEYERLKARKEKAESLSPNEVIKYLPEYVYICKRLLELANNFELGASAVYITESIAANERVPEILNLFKDEFYKWIEIKDFTAVLILIHLMDRYGRRGVATE